MRPAWSAGCLAALIGVALAGCLGDGAGGGDGDEDGALPVGVHPYPAGDGSEWPVGLEGPFGLLPIENVKVTATDEIQLDGWVLRPDVPDGVKVPVVLWSAPYFGQCSWMPPTAVPPAVPPTYPVCSYETGDDHELRDASSASEAVPIDRLISEGYAVAVFNVRGTGNSGGCFEWFGPKEQADQALLVEWLAGQEWSNGRVAMMGLSYHGTTPWEAAINTPPSLKTIVVAGMVSDAYTFSHTPQGATFATIGVFDAHFFWRVSGSPPLGGGVEHNAGHAAVVAERMCQETADTLREEWSGTYTDVRNGPYWDARRLIDRFPDITASVLLTHGFDDNVGSGHQQQENAVWDTLVQAPKRMMQGQWGHMMPDIDPEFEPTYGAHWHDVAVGWLDYWLKGIGAPERLGVVDYQDGEDDWHASDRWPPAEAKEEVLYLTQGSLAAEPGEEAAYFQDIDSAGTGALLCGDELLPPSPAPGVVPTNAGVVYLSEPVREDTFLAGNPIAYLQVSSDLPGGLVAIDLYDVPPDCRDAIFLGRGVADLRFHDGVFTGHDFPMNEPTPVRFDITDFAEWLPAGDRLGVVLSRGDVIDRASPYYGALIGIHGDGSLGSSHVVVPVIEGGFGGEAPSLHYPPRPFVPPEGQRPDSR